MALLRNTNGFQFAGSTLLYYTGDASVVSIPDGVIKIAEEAFANNKKLEKLVLPDSLECIESNAFIKCKKLKDVNLPQNLKKIGASAFKECGLESVHIPTSVEVIEKGAFQFCKNLKEVVIAPPKTQLIVGGYVFQNTAIETIVFPSGVVEIGNYAVSSCQNLKHIYIQEKTAKLGENLVYLDSTLESVVILNGVKTLKLKTLATDGMLNGALCCASKILVPLGSLKTLQKSPFEAYHIVSIAAATYMENVAQFGKKEQKAWDAYIAENADQIREKLGDNLSAEIARYFADRRL